MLDRKLLETVCEKWSLKSDLEFVRYVANLVSRYQWSDDYYHREMSGLIQNFCHLVLEKRDFAEEQRARVLALQKSTLDYKSIKPLYI